MLGAFTQDPVDIVFSSFAIHHGRFQDKSALFSSLKSRIKEGGIFIFADALRPVDYSWREYIQMIDTYFRSCNKATSQVVDTIMNHVRQFDFPEKLPAYETIVKQ